MKVINDGNLLKGKVTVALTTCTYVIVKISIPVAHVITECGQMHWVFLNT